MVLAARDVALAEETVRLLYARGEADRARAVEAVLAHALVRSEIAPSRDSEHLTTGQAARALGVGAQTIKDWIASGSLHAVRIRGRLLIPRESVQVYLDALRENQQQESAPSPEIAESARQQHEYVLAGLPAETVARLETLIDKLQDGGRITKAEHEEMADLEQQIAAISRQRLQKWIHGTGQKPATP